MLQNLPSQLVKYEGKINATLREFVQLDIGIMSQSNPQETWHSKLGGLPYLPENTSYPMDSESNPMELLVQINFDELPKLPGFPQTGLFQIFIPFSGSENDYGMDEHKIVYYKEYDTNSFVTDFAKIISWRKTHSSDCHGPYEYLYWIEGDMVDEYPLTGVLNYSVIDPSDAEFDIMLPELSSDTNLIDFNIYQEWYRSQNTGIESRIGGYSSVWQRDPRLGVDSLAGYKLLIEICSDEKKQIWFGDAGQVNVYIDPVDLEKNNFEDIEYYFDCA